MYLPDEEEDLCCLSGLVTIHIVAAAGFFHEKYSVTHLSI